MAEPKPLKITVLDTATGETGHAEIYPGDYFLLCAAPCRVSSRSASSTGTQQITINSYAPRGKGTVTYSGGAPEQDTGVDLIAAERRRQVEDEGWTPEHDAKHEMDQLARAAAAYALPPWLRATLNDIAGREPIHERPPVWWPWVKFKPSPQDRLREVVKAGALLAAEADRLLAEQRFDADMVAWRNARAGDRDG